MKRYVSNCCNSSGWHCSGARVRISDSDLENYYKEKRTRKSNEFEVSASHILLKVRASTSADEGAQYVNEPGQS